MVRTNSEQGAASKSECVTEMASHLDDADEVPAQLREVFTQLVDLASHPGVSAGQQEDSQ